MKATKRSKSLDSTASSTGQIPQRRVDCRWPVTLLVDDSWIAREMVKMIIRHNHIHCRVIEAETSEQALELAKHVQVDCVISDLIRPGMDAFQFIKAFRLAHPFVPILIHSGHAFGARALRARQLGAFRCLSKPQRAENIHDAVTEALKQRKALKRRSRSVV